jgi:hypothetical protein
MPGTGQRWVTALRIAVAVAGVLLAVVLFAGGSVGAADTPGITGWETALLLAPAVLIFAGAISAVWLPWVAVGAFAAAFVVTALVGFGPLSALPLLLLAVEVATLWPARS